MNNSTASMSMHNTRARKARRRRLAGLGVMAVLSVCPAVMLSAAVSATTPDAVITLRIGTDDVPVKPATDQIEQFARAVAERSEGSIVIEPVWHAAGDVANGDFDQHVARMVTSGELEMGLIPARAWDTEGVTTLRALQTPFLITDEALVDEIVSDDDLTGELMSGLDAAGVVGLGLFPEGLRHPFSALIVDDSGELAYGDPLLSPADYQGAVLGWITSAQTAAMFEALGVTRFDDETDPTLLVGRESSYQFAPPGTATGNVTFFPKVNSLVINADVWAGLSAEQQAILTDAAADTREWAIDHVQSDHDAALQRCADGFGIVLASEEDLAGLPEATAPVVAELREDPATAALIDEITAMRDAMPPAVIEPVTCEAAPLPTTPSVEDTAVPASVGESAEFPEGVYRYEATLQSFLDAGLDRDLAAQLAGTSELTFSDGELTTVFVADATGQPIVDHQAYCIDGDRVTVGDPSNHMQACNDLWSARWEFDGDELRFVDFEVLIPGQGDDTVLPAIFTNRPFLRIGDAPSDTTTAGDTTSDADSGAAPEATTPSVEDTAVPASVAESGEFPEGVYYMERTSDEMLAHGASPEQAVSDLQTFTMTFDNGTWLGVTNATDCPGTYTVDAGRVAVVCTIAGPMFEANWTLDGDQLLFTNVVADGGSPEVTDDPFWEWYWAGPLTRIGDAPADTTATGDASPANDGGDAAADTTSPSVEETAVESSVAASQEFPDGVYQMEMTSDELLAHGATPEQAFGLEGTFTSTFDNGTFSGEDPSGICFGTYTVDAGRITVRLSPAPNCGPGGTLLEANWALDGDQLQFTDVVFGVTGDPFFEWVTGGKPWTRIGDAPPVATTAPSVEETAAVSSSVAASEEFPDGVYQRETTRDELIAHGSPPDIALYLGGVNTLILDHGTWTHLDPTGFTNPSATDTADEGRFTLVGPDGGVALEASWSLDGDQLQFTDMEITDPELNDLFVWFWSGPWTRIGDPPADTTPVETTSPTDSDQG